MSNGQLDQALAAADSCFQTWKHKRFAERAVALNKAAALLHAHVDDLAKLETLEMGKRVEEARGEVKFSGDMLAYYAKNAEAFLAPAKLHPKVGDAHMESSATGVLFCVEPCNFPYFQLARVAGPQLMAGNVLVVKHASCDLTPMSGLAEGEFPGGGWLQVSDLPERAASCSCTLTGFNVAMEVNRLEKLGVATGAKMHRLNRCQQW